VLEKLPLFVLSAASCVATYLIQKDWGAMSLNAHFPLATRIENALVAYATYLAKTVWPQGLSVWYPYEAPLPLWSVAASVLVLLALSVVALWQIRRRPYLLVGWLWFLGTLVPVIGLVQVGGQAMADRYTYIPLIGLFIAAVWTAAEALAARPQRQHLLALLAAAAVLVPCAAATWMQIGAWHDSVALFGHAFAVNPDNAWAEARLGGALLVAGGRDIPAAKLDEAISHLRHAADRKSGLTQAQCDLGRALILKGDLEGASARLATALHQQPNYPEARNGYGLLLLAQGKTPEAVEQLEMAVGLKPLFLEARENLVAAYGKAGRRDDAVREAEVGAILAEALERPDLAYRFEQEAEQYRHPEPKK
jgi:tetratricopeptide (TPR) repeat protein